MAPQERRSVCLRLAFVKPLRSEKSSARGTAVYPACIARRPTHPSTCRLIMRINVLEPAAATSVVEEPSPIAAMQCAVVSGL